MTFSEYALGLSPFISFGKSEHDYFTELVGNFVKDAAMDSCQMLKRQPDTKYRYIKGSRPIQQKDAQYLYDYRDLDKFSKWIWDRMDDSDSYDNVVDWLAKHDIADDDPSTACAKLLENILLDIINGSSMPQIAKESEIDLELIDEIQQKIKSLPRPANVPVPAVATEDEQKYISELYLAYGDAEDMDSFSGKDLSSFPDYAEDLDDRRVDFYAAETIRRGVMELGSGGLANQFDVLKDETFVGVSSYFNPADSQNCAISHLAVFTAFISMSQIEISKRLDNILLDFRNSESKETISLPSPQNGSIMCNSEEKVSYT